MSQTEKNKNRLISLMKQQMNEHTDSGAVVTRGAGGGREVRRVKGSTLRRWKRTGRWVVSTLCNRWMMHSRE